MSHPNEGARSGARHVRRAWPLLVTFAALLVACGGGGGGGGNTSVVASADSLTVGAGDSGTLLANDRFGGGAASAGAGGNVSFTLFTRTLPAGVTVTDGVVTASDAAATGSFTLSYRICEAQRPENCAFANATVTITVPTLRAGADSLNLAPGSSGDVLANDTIGSNPATASRVTVSPITSLPAGVTLSSAGVVDVAATTRAGTYLLGYRICQTGSTTNCTNGSAQLTVPGPNAVYGRVVDAASAQGVAGVRVSVGGLSTLTDANGAFEIANVPQDPRAIVEFAGAGYASGARVATITNGATELQPRLMPVGATADLPPASGGTVTQAGSTAQVVLAADAAQRADGSAPSGSVRVRMTPINPALDSSLLPGDYTTLVAGTPAPIESFGGLAVELEDTSGAPLNLRSGQSAVIRIPFGSRNASPPPTAPLFYFDLSSGRWVQEGTATLAGTGANRYYEGTVSHFSVWTAGLAYETVRVNGCVSDAAGARVPGAFVQSDGIDYSGTTDTSTDAGGNFAILLKRSASATITATAGGVFTNTLGVGPFTAAADLGGCLTQGVSGTGVTMKLTWGDTPNDLDSHLYAPDGSHVFYASKGNLGAAPYASLDVDDVTKFGPEVVTVNRLMVGTYRYAVHNYSGQNSGMFSASGARVLLNIAGRSVELFTVPASGETTSTNWWLLFEFDVDASCNIVVRRTGTYQDAPPTTGTAATPTYCNRP